VQSNLLRKLAGEYKWQLLYSKSKEIPNICLFKNTSDFTRLQINFLQWLEIYHSLEVDLAMQEPFISREVIEDEIRTDAYLLWKSKKNEKSSKQKDKPTKVPDNNSKVATVLFKGKK
jgi:hypothetical protein